MPVVRNIQEVLQRPLADAHRAPGRTPGGAAVAVQNEPRKMDRFLLQLQNTAHKSEQNKWIKNK